MRILVVEDEKINLVTLSDSLRGGGHDVCGCATAEEAIERLSDGEFDLALVDYKLPGALNGLDVLSEIREKHPETDVIMMSAYGTIDVAVKAMKYGAGDFIIKPFGMDEMLLKVGKMEKHRSLVRENVLLRSAVEDRYSRYNVVGKSKGMQNIYDLVEAYVDSGSSVLLSGESGTGKGLIARALHYGGCRRNCPFVEIHCGAIPESIMESELFGHVKGAFTGAVQDRVGKLAAAGEGTVYLDDIDAMPMSMQVKLLRVLQENEFERVGDNKTIRFRARVLASVKPDIADLVREGRFREDLYFRLNVLNLNIPPLRQRKEDIPLLIDFFLLKHKKKIASPVASFSPEALSALMEYPFPGNVRELEHIVERMLHICREEAVGPENLPAEVRSPDSFSLNIMLNEPGEDGFSLTTMIENLEKKFYGWALEKAGGNQSKAARLLDVPRSTLQERIRKYNLPHGGD